MKRPLFLSPLALLPLFTLAAPDLSAADPTLYLKQATAQDAEHIRLRFADSGTIYAPEYPLKGKPEELVSVTPEVPNLKMFFQNRDILLTGDFKSGEKYEIRVSRRLEDQAGHTLFRDAVVEQKIPEKPRFLDFVLDGTILPLYGEKLSLPLRARHVKKCNLKIYRIYDHNLVEGSFNPDNYGECIVEKKNVPLKHTKSDGSFFYDEVDLNGLLPEKKTGIYSLQITDSDIPGYNYYTSRTKYFIISDMAATADIDYSRGTAHVFVHSISTGKPVDGAEVTLVTKKRFTASAKAQKGFAKLSLSLRPGDEFSHIAVRNGDDMLLFSLSKWNCMILARDEESEWKEDGLRAFVYAERNIIRPGETIHPAFYLKEFRDGVNKTVKNAPVRLMLFDPSQNLIRNIPVTTDENGFATHPFTLPDTAETGVYTIACGLSEKQLFGSFSFTSALFMPDRIRVKLRADEVQLKMDEKVHLNASARYYFDEKLPKAAWQFSLQFAGMYVPPHFKGWEVGVNESFQSSSYRSDTKAFSTVDGVDSLSVTFPSFAEAYKGNKFFQPVVLRAECSVSDYLSRGVTDSAQIIVHPTKTYLGLRDAESPDPLSKRIEYTVLPAVKGRQVRLNGEKMKILLEEIRWEYLMRENSGGSFSREWEMLTIPVTGMPDEETLKEGIHALTFRNLKPGEYRLTVTSGDMRSTMTFWHSGGTAGKRSANPRDITVRTDKDIYKPGDTARLTIDLEKDTWLYCSYGETAVEGTLSMALPKGEQTIEIPIRKTLESTTWHAALTTVSGCSSDTQRNFSLLNLKVDQNGHKILPSLKLPDVVRPGEKIRAGIRLLSADGKPHQGVVHVFGVDEGILSLTGFHVPDIFRAFHGSYHWNAGHIDLFNEIFPDLKLTPEGNIGGDGNGGGARADKLVNLKFRESAVFTLPPVRIPESGEGEVLLPIPDFTGSMRIMAVAASGDAVGSSEQNVTVRAPVTVHITAPVTVSPADRFQVTVQVMNHEKRTVPLQVELSVPGQLECGRDSLAPREIVLKEKGTEWITFTCTAKNPPGEGVITVKATGKDGSLYKDEAPVTVRTVSAYETRLETVLLAPGAEKSFRAGGQEKPESGSITVSDAFASAAEPALAFLNNYPYGCAEQTVSQAFPLLYADLLVQCGLISKEAADTAKDKIVPAYNYLLTMMRYNGTFSMWPGGGRTWEEASVYAAHFIVEGMNRRLIPENNVVRDRLFRYLLSLLNNSRSSRRQALLHAYACYVLAAGANERFISFARNLMPAPGERYNFASFIAACAMIRGGYAAEGAEHLRSALSDGAHLAPVTLFSNSYAAGYGMALTLLAEHAPDSEDIPEIAVRLIREIRSDDTVWGTTQDNAWAVMGLASLGRNLSGKEGNDCTVKVSSGGKERSVTVKGQVKLQDQAPLSVRNTGNSLLLLQKKSVMPAPLATKGPVILGREYLDAAGNPVTKVRHGDLVTVRLHVESPAEMPSAVLCDILPAGLEIEDSRLLTRSSRQLTNPKIEQEGDVLIPTCLEKRFDRLLFFGRVPAGRRYFDYKARAVSRGVFRLSPFTAEEMYNPLLRGSFFAGDLFTVE